MSARLGRLWRGEIALTKTFWFFGVVVFPLFSLIFISLRPILASLLKKSLYTILYLDYFLVAVYAVYGVIIVVAIWRSANKYEGPRKWSRLAKLSGIILVVWFAANLGLYAFIKTITPPVLELKMDYTPKKLLLSNPDVVADSLCFGEFKLKIPFYKEDIKDVWPFFHEDRIIIMNVSLGLKGTIMLEWSVIPTPKEPIATKVLHSLLNMRSVSLVEIFREAHYSRLKDYSWWNVRKNLRLAMNLILKAITVTSGNFKSVSVYETESPYMKGLLLDGLSKNNRHMIDFKFEWRGKTYSIFVMSNDEDVLTKVRDMISSVRPIDDSDKCYKEIKALYEHKEKSRYPDEVLLLSLISVKTPTMDDMKDLLTIEDRKQDKQYAIDAIKKEMAFLRRMQTKKQ